MVKIPFINRRKSLAEEQEENEQLAVEYDNEKYRAAIRELKKRGVDPKQFHFSLSAIQNFLKNH